MSASERPHPDEYAPYYAAYIARVTESSVVPVLEEQIGLLSEVAAIVPPERESWRYATGKWSIREVFGHICDAERVFGFRAFCFSRGEEQPLPGFDEGDYIQRSSYDRRPLASLAAEFEALRASNLAVFRSLDDTAWGNTGTASNAKVSVRALAYIMAGHVRHHVEVLKERYGVT